MTGLLSTCGLQFHDWTAAYRLFARDRMDLSRIFEFVRQEAVDQLPGDAPLCIAMDNSLLRKTGIRTHGVAWRRDPLGPPFQANLIRAQRILQLSLALPEACGASPARLIPIDFRHVPTPPKPGAKATKQERDEYEKKRKEANLSLQAVARIENLAEGLKKDGKCPGRLTYLGVDGGFTNRTVMKGLPEGMHLIGRIRSDAKLYALPQVPPAGRKGRRRSYGEILPTPEVLRKDESAPWQPVRVFAAGKEHDYRVKSLCPVLWRAAGANRLLRLIVIAPLAYRPRKSSKILYRQPAYLITTDCESPLDRILQNYVWRWGIEVNFRDEKTLLGVGQAQVRLKPSTENVPGLIVASYAMLLLAGMRCRKNFTRANTLQPPKWNRNRPPEKFSTQSLINRLRAELWSRALGLEHFSGFLTDSTKGQKPEKLKPSLPSAAIYAAA